MDPSEPVQTRTFCATCAAEIQGMYGSRRVPCEECAGTATTCAPRNEEADPTNVVHAWLCETCARRRLQ
jgi:hypothetical protein